MDDFDLAIYYPIPLLTTGGYVSLMQTLAVVAPQNPPEHVAEAIATLKKARIKAKAQLVSRIGEDLSTGLERLFDLFVDQVWVELHQRLEFATIYNHAGAAKLTDEDREQLDFDERLAEGRIAATMLERMFSNGVDFLRAKYPQQSTHMATRLEWVESENYQDSLEEIVGPKLVALLKVCQNRYEAMVSERSSRDGTSVADLGKLRQQRKQVYVYAGAIGTLYKEDKPETAEIVENALRPILIAREEARHAVLAVVEEAAPIVEDEDEGIEEDEDEDGEPETE